MTVDLSRRIARAFAAGAATLAEREQLRAAAGPVEVRTVDDLPTAARSLLTDLESRGRA
jgi:hypothetical protein